MKRNSLLNSASRIVFIAVAFAVIVLTFMRIVDAKDFLGLAGMVFVYYFSKPAPIPENVSSTIITGDTPVEK